MDDIISVQGLSWCKEQPKTIGTSSLTKKFLCEHHNRSLSPYDNEARKFFKLMLDIGSLPSKVKDGSYIDPGRDQYFDINGKFLERWFLKTLINVSLTENNDIDVSSDAIQNALFDQYKFEQPYGLAFVFLDNQKGVLANNFRILPFFETTDSGRIPAYGVFNVFSYKLILILPSKREVFDRQNRLKIEPSPHLNLEEWEGAKHHWHLNELNFQINPTRLLTRKYTVVFHY